MGKCASVVAPAKLELRYDAKGAYAHTEVGISRGESPAHAPVIYKTATRPARAATSKSGS